LSTLFGATFGGSGGKIVSAQWTFSDGITADAMRSNGTVSRTLPNPGSISAVLVVADDQGLGCRATGVASASTADGVFPPQIVTTPTLTASCGDAYVYGADGRVRASGSAPITWSLGKGGGPDGAPDGMSIDASGLISWTPATSQAGPTRVTVVAQNKAGTNEQDFLVDVACTVQVVKGCHCDSSGGSVTFLAFALALFLRRRSAIVKRRSS
jgi:hypothetical protein